MKKKINTAASHLGGVYAVYDGDGKLTALLHEPANIAGLPGWIAVRGRFVPNKRQAKAKK